MRSAQMITKIEDHLPISSGEIAIANEKVIYAGKETDLTGEHLAT